jgi:L-ribulose-5-phosphate 3-epimerase
MQARVPDLSYIPVGLYEKALPPELSWPERLLTAANAGYDFVEISIDDSDERIARLDWGPEQRAALRNAVSDTGVPLKSMSLSAHRRFPMGSASPQTRQIGLDILKKAIDFTVDTGLRFILVAGSDVYHEESNEGTRQRYLEGLERGFEWATQAGVMLALENWDVEAVDSVQKAMWYVRHFNSPWFQHYVDIGNLVYAGHDVVSELEAGRGHIAAVHIKDTQRGQLRYVPPGEGSVPFVEAFAKLAEIGFYGPVLLELWTEHDPDALEIVTDASAWVRERMAEGWKLHQDRHSAKKGAEV